MKTLFFLAFLALAVTSAVARADTTCSQSYGQQGQQQQQQQLINLGRAYLQQCTPRTVPFTYATGEGEQASSCQVMMQQFCQQLDQIPEQFRCQAVNGVAEAIMQLQQQQQLQGFYQAEEQAHFDIMRAALHTLPQMCRVYVPSYCITTISPCSIPKAGTSAGAGAYY